MAENKKSFVLYADLLHTVQKLPDEKAGVLLKTILEYVNDLNPKVDDILVDLVFEPIKQQLKRDLKKYDSFREKQSLNGKLGGRPKKEENPKNPSLSEENHETQKSLNVTVNVNDTVNDIKLEVEEEEGENFKIIVDLKTVTDLKKFIKEKFARSEEDLKMKLTSAKYLERQEAFILRNNERSYTSDNDFLNHYRNFILKNPQPEKEKSSGQKEKPSRTAQILNTHEQYLSTLQA